MSAIHARIFKNKSLLFLILGIVGILFMYFFIDWITTVRLVGIRIIYDSHDIGVYYNSSRWVAEEGRLYKEVFSEYPLLANLIFGFIRLLAEKLQPLPTSELSFIWLWMSVAWCFYLGLLYQLSQKFPKIVVLTFLTPSILYFSLLRFDIYPVFFTFISLLAIRDCKYYQGAFWLGIAIALKGYCIFLLPPYFIFCCYKKGLIDSLKVMAICLAPILLGHLSILSYAGLEGSNEAYVGHMQRGLNRQSTYDALFYLFRLQFILKISDFPWIGQVLQVISCLVAAALRPKNFDDLIHSFLLAIVGFISFSLFYSPQYILWIFSISCFSNSMLILWLTLLYSLISYIYFPIAFDKRGYSLSFLAQKIRVGRALYRTTIVAMTVIRFVMMYANIKALVKTKR